MATYQAYQHWRDYLRLITMYIITHVFAARWWANFTAAVKVEFAFTGRANRHL